MSVSASPVETIDSVCKRFCPLFHLHPSERYKPCSLPELMRHCRFEYYGADAASMFSSSPPDNNGTSSSSPPPYNNGTSSSPPNMFVIDNSILSAADTKEKLLELLSRFTGLGAKTNSYRLLIVNKDMPASTEVQAIFSDPFVFLKKTYFTVTYLLFYPFNGTLEPHVFDQEYATVLFECKKAEIINTSFEITNPVIKRIYLSSHGKGKWFDKDELDCTTDGRPDIYISLASHSMYPKAMVLRRFFGIANDVTKDTGDIYDPIENVVVLANSLSVLNKQYYELNKLYYYNGLYEDQTSILFNDRRINFLKYDGYYKVSSTSELWEIEQFKIYGSIINVLIVACSALILVILVVESIDKDNVLILISHFSVIVLAVIVTFLVIWKHFS